MSYSFKLWSHPEKLLKDHIMNVFKNGQLLSKEVTFEDSYKQVLDLVLLLHDVGKASSYFQKYIKAIDQFEKDEINKERLEEIKYKLGKHKNHARISAVWTFIAIDQQLHDKKSALIGFLAVLRHHGHLQNLDEMLAFKKTDFDILLDTSQYLNYEEYQQVLELNGYRISEFNHRNFKNWLDNFFNTRKYRRNWKKGIKKKLSSKTFYKASLIFSLLLSADKGECIFDGIVYQRQNPHLPPTLIDNYKEEKFGTADKKINQLRNQVYNSAYDTLDNLTARDHFLSLNVPTGIGKTLAVLNVALTLQAKRKKIDKIVYCLPFTSIIDQNAEIIEDILEVNELDQSSENLIINHHLQELTYQSNTDEGEIDDNRGEYLVHQFEANINVTTFYQLLHGIFTNKNHEIRKLQSFANSIIILDEVQNIPSKYWPLVRNVFKNLASKLNITFVLVTATMPMIFSEEKGEIQELVQNKKSVFQSLDRINLDTSLLRKDITKTELLEILERDLCTNQDKSFLVILNTIKSSKIIYDKLKEKGFSRLKYLSTNITPKERSERIREIKKRDQPYIVISTQLVEAGVDIDLDIVYRDLAPMDSVFQSAGRCNRNNEDQKGTVKLFSLLDGDKRYASYVYGVPDLFATRNLLTEKTLYSESEFFSLSNTYYKNIVKNPDDSTFILNQMDILNYDEAFNTNKDKRAFQLIEDRPTYPAYVAFEPEATDLLDKYQKLIDIEFGDPYEKKRAVKNHLKKMNQYMISIPEKYAYKRDDQDYFFYIVSEKHMDFGYDPETGMIYEGGVAFF